MVQIEFQDVVKSWRRRDSEFVLTVPSLQLVSGEAVSLVGPNGAGKSTLLELIGLAASPDRPAPGSIRFTAERRRCRLRRNECIDIAGMWRRGAFDALARLRATQFGFVLQTAGLLPFLSLRRNAELAQDLAGRRDRRYIDLLMARLDLTAQQHLMPSELSLGLRQRGAIARALAHRPSFVLADEPTASLDDASRDGALALLLELANDEGVGVLIASHDQRSLAGFGLRSVEAKLVEDRPERRAAVIQARF